MSRLKIFRPAILCFFLTFLAIFLPELDAYYGDAAETVQVNRMNVGLQAFVFTKPAISGSLSLGLGLSPWLSMHIEGGYGTTDIATNSFIGRLLFKAFLTKNFGGVDQFSLLLGAGYDKYPSAQGALLLSTSRKYFDLYTGMDAAWWFKPSQPNLLMQFLLGVKIKNFLSAGRFKPSAVLEIAVPLTNYTSFTFTLGLRMFMDFKIVKGQP